MCIFQLRRFYNEKIISLSLALLLILVGLSACGGTADSGESSEASGSDSDSLSIVTTIFPVYEWTRNIVGENADIKMLIDSGVDLHSYQPSAEDILRISECDVFIYVGGESDEWVGDALGEAVNKDMVVLNLMEALGGRAKEEESVEGMQAEEHEHGNGEAHEEEEEMHEHEEGPEYDEHIWLSLQNASVLSGVIADALSKADETNAETYRANAVAYKEKVAALDESYKEAVSEASVRTLLFGDRFPFRYMTDDYDLDYYAAFAGCSAETEASFETIAFLASKVDELGLKTIMTIEGSDRSIAESIAENTKNKNQTILALDSMQSTTAEDVDAGADYLSIMESNLEVLKQALK